jgi:NaMN:DMB phosphoribosyltransferase
MEQVFPARDFSKKDEFECESCEETYSEAYVIASDKEEARRMVKTGEVLCSTCTVEAIIRSYMLEKRNGC